MGYQAGSWWALCDICGFKFRSEDLQERWDGLRTCRKDFETRHPQEFVRPRPEDTSPPWIRPDGTEDDITIQTSSPQTMVASLTPSVLYIDTTAGNITVNIPAANDATFIAGSQVIYMVYNYGTANAGTVTPASGSVIGSASVGATTMARFLNNRVTNTWTRL